MEILIQLAGERIGPFSESQVRRYIDEGLVTLSDLASCQGAEDWHPVEELLANLSPAPSAPPPERPASRDTSSLPEVKTSANGTTSLPAEPFLALAAAQKAKRRNGRSGGDSSRATAALPPVGAVTAREKTSTKSLPRTGRVALLDIPGKIETPAPLPVEARAPAKPPPLPVAKAPAPVETPAPEQPAAKAPPVVIPAPIEVAAPIETAPPTIETPPVAEKPNVAPVEERPAVPQVEPKTEVAPAPVPAAAPVTVAPEKPRPQQKVRGHIEDEELFSRFVRWSFIACFCFLVVTVCSVLYFIYRASIPHDKSHHAVLLKSDAVPAGQAPAERAPSIDIKNPKTAADFANRGVSRKDAGDINNATADFNRALSLDPNNALAAYNRGLIRQKMGDLNGAMTDFTTVISTDPKNSHAFNNRGYLKQVLGDLDGAIADYDQALFLDPKNAVAYYNVGLIRVKQGDLDGAIAAYNLALDNDPKMAIVYYNRGGVKNMEGNLEGAIADYTQAIILDPKIAPAFCDRGSARQSKGDLDGALADYTEALALNPNLGIVYYNRCLIRMLKGDLNSAIDDSSHAIDIDGKDAPAYFRRGLARFGTGAYADALTDLRKFCELAPRDNNADTARIYAWVAAKRINPKGTADEDLASALQNDWNESPEEFSSIIAGFLLGHINESDLVANAASPDENLEPGQYCKAWYFAGIKQRQAGNINTAINYFQKCLATNQSDYCEYIFAKIELQALHHGGDSTPKAAAATP